MSKLYVVIQVCQETKNNYKMDEISQTFNIAMPFVFTDRDRAYREAEKKRKAHVPCFVKEFPYNPLDNRIDAMQKKIDADAEYIADLECEIEELESVIEELEGRVNQ